MSVPRKAYGWGRGLGPTPPRESAPPRECVELGECRPPHRSRKDRARWCRGKEGVEHQWAWVDERTLPNTQANRRGSQSLDGFTYTQERKVCQTCGKQRESRRRCHCGTLMTDGRRWLSGECPSCHYTPFWISRVIQQPNGTRIWVDAPGRPVHTCPRMSEHPARR